MASAAAERRAFRAQLALGMRLASDGFASRAAFVLAGALTVGFALFALRIGRRDGAAALADVVALSSTALAWSAGLLYVLAASGRSFVLDRSRGILALYALHAAGWRRYVTVRTLALGIQLLRVVSIGSLLVAFAGGAFVSRPGVVAAAARGFAASLVYAFGFALVLAPLGAATMGARARSRGFTWLLAALLGPELVKGATVRVLDTSWRTVLPVHSALASLRALVLGEEEPRRALHALVVLAVTAVLASLLLRGEVGRDDARRRALAGVASGAAS